MDPPGGGGATGSHSTSTHLFQAGVRSSLPVPVHGVAPLHNQALWGMAQPQGGRPATFVVGDAVRRFIGVDATGAALHLGCFTGQMLALGQPGVDGMVLVAVTGAFTMP